MPETQEERNKNPRGVLTKVVLKKRFHEAKTTRLKLASAAVINEQRLAPLSNLLFPRQEQTSIQLLSNNTYQYREGNT